MRLGVRITLEGFKFAMAGAEEEHDESLESFFVDENYVEQSFVVGPYNIPILSLQSSSTDYDLTGQILWPGTELLNEYILRNSATFKGTSVIELGSGVGLTGLLCGHICGHVVMTDHSDTVLKIMKKNVELQSAPVDGRALFPSIVCEKLEWGKEDQVAVILEKNPRGFDFVLGADICYQQNSLPPLFRTVRQLLSYRGSRACKFVLAYVSRVHSTDLAFFTEASRHNLEVLEIPDSRMRVGGGIHEGVVYEVNLRSQISSEKY